MTAICPAGCSKWPRFSPAQPQRAKTRCSAGKAAASEEARRTLRYFEPLSEARTTLGKRSDSARCGRAGEKDDFFSILLVERAVAKTGYHRADRVADQIRMEVADILMRKIKDPRVQSVTVTDVKLTADLRIARVFVTTMGTEEEERNVFAGLGQANGFVRGELGRRLSLRYLPEIVFAKDVSGPRGDRVLKLLDELHAKTEAEGGS